MHNSSQVNNNQNDIVIESVIYIQTFSNDGAIVRNEPKLKLNVLCYFFGVDADVLDRSVNMCENTRYDCISDKIERDSSMAGMMGIL